jgi:uncharacterized membrane protein
LGRVKLVTAVASLVGVGVYNSYLQDVPLRTVFFWTIVMGTVLGLTQLLLVTGINQSLGISNEWFSIGDSLVLTVLGQVQIPASFSIGFVSSLLLRVCIPPCPHLIKFEELPYSSEDLLVLELKRSIA